MPRCRSTDFFCQVTGFDGTPRVASKALSDTVLEKTMTIQFDANVAPGLPWRFEPAQTTQQVKIGENALAFYGVTNTSDRPVRGTATFNVLSGAGGPLLQQARVLLLHGATAAARRIAGDAGELLCGPAIAGDKDAHGVGHITLSYTFYPVVAPKPGVARKESSPATPETVPRSGQAGNSGFEGRIGTNAAATQGIRDR